MRILTDVEADALMCDTELLARLASRFRAPSAIAELCRRIDAGRRDGW